MGRKPYAIPPQYDVQMVLDWMERKKYTKNTILQLKSFLNRFVIIYESIENIPNDANVVCKECNLDKTRTQRSRARWAINKLEEYNNESNKRRF